MSLSWNSSVTIATGYRLDDQMIGFQFPVGAGNFSLQHHFQPPIQWVPAALSLGVKQPGHGTVHSPPSSAVVKECMDLYFHSPNTSWHGA